MITFVTGVSTSGKTTTMQAFEKAVKPAPFGDGPYVVDLDDHERPDAGHIPWLQWRGEQLLYEALVRLDDLQVPTVVFGILWPHRLIDSTAWEQFPKSLPMAGFVLLDVSDELMETRLRQRLGDDDDTDEYVRYNRRLGVTLRQQFVHQVNSTVISVDGLTPERIAGAIPWIW